MSDTEQEQVLGDAASFPRFYADAYDEVYRVLALTLRDPELAADAVHEALARAYESWDDVSGYANPTGWVYRVALNWSRSWFRRRAREVLVRRPPDRAVRGMPASVDPAVAEALESLPADQRVVVVMRLYLDWSVEDVATALGVAPGTVKSRLSRALEALRVRLEVGR